MQKNYFNFSVLVKSYPYILKFLIIPMELDLSNLLKEAKAHAFQNGKIIGRVTRYKDITINDSEYIGVDIDFENYLEADIKRGQYLAIRSIIRPVIILGQVYSISRSDVFARMGIEEVSYHEDPATIATPTYVEMKPITEAEYSKNNGKWEIKTIRPSVSAIDPQSPVFNPSPSLLTQLLNIPSEGIAIGKIFSGGNPIEATVKLDEKTLTHHVLVVGTTGAGKTTLLKTIVSEAIKVNREKEKKIKTLIFDRQGDFVRYLMEKGEEFAVIMPVTERESHNISLQHYAEDFKSWYECDNFEITEGEIYKKEAIVSCDNSKIFLIPYSINFYFNLKRFNKITPYFTPRASMYWEPIVERTREKLDQAINQASEFIGGEKKKGDVRNQIISTIATHLTPEKLTEKSIIVNLDDLATTLNIDINKLPTNDRDYLGGGYKYSFW